MPFQETRMCLNGVGSPLACTDAEARTVLCSAICRHFCQNVHAGQQAEIDPIIALFVLPLLLKYIGMTCHDSFMCVRK